MHILIRLLLVLGVLCLGMNFIGVVYSYYATLNRLAANPDASVDALADGAGLLQQNPWSTWGWTTLGVLLIAAAICLAFTRRKRRK